MRYETITFREVRVTYQRKGRCAGCGEPVRQRRTFSQTVSPFNRNPDGTVRTVAEVQAAVEQEARDWQTSPPWHSGCRQSQEEP